MNGHGVRLARVVLTGLLFTLMILAAVLIGRAIPTTFVSLDLTAATDLDRVRFGIADVNRPYVRQLARLTPGKTAAALDRRTLRVLQRVSHLEFAYWTYSEIDIVTGAVRSSMRVTAGPGDLLTLDDFTLVTLPDGSQRRRVYLPESGEVWESALNEEESSLAASLDRNLSAVVSLDGGQRYFTVGLNGLSIVEAATGRRVDVTIESAANSLPAFSRSGRWLFMHVPAVNLVNGSLTVYNAETLAAARVFSGYMPAWCADSLSYFSIDSAGEVTVHLADLETGAGQAVQISGAPPELGDMSSGPLADSCEWFSFRGAFGGRNWLLHRDTGQFIPLSLNGRVLEITPDGVVYQTQLGETLQFRRIMRRAGVFESELIASYPLVGAPITYFEGLRRGLVIAAGVLQRVDLATGVTSVVAESRVRSFYVLD